MGVTDWKLLTVAGNENFRRACEKEADSRFYWVEKWGWMAKEIIDVKLAMLKLREIRRKRRDILESKKADSIDTSKELIILEDPCPYPDTSNHEYGWLHHYKDWNLEKFGPFPLSPIKPRTTFTKEEIDEIIEQKKKERRERIRKLLQRK